MSLRWKGGPIVVDGVVVGCYPHFNGGRVEVDMEEWTNNGLLFSYPEEYQNPKVGDRLKIEIGLKLVPGRKRRRRLATIIEWPIPERESIHEIVGWDS